MTRAPDLFGAAEAKPVHPAAEIRRCRVCREPGAGLSDDLGRTWFCPSDAPRGFFPKDRAR